MKKIFVHLLVFIGLLSMTVLAPIGNTTLQTTVSNRILSVNMLAPDPIFPTNATFETKIEVVGNASVGTVGGSGTDYYAQSFKALSDYVVNGGLWIEPYAGVTPDYRLLLCNSTGFGWPNVAHPINLSQVISGVAIDANPGRFYLNLTTPIRVQQNETYWLVIDGYYDHVTVGNGRSSRQAGNPYSDGLFAYSNNNGTTWTEFSGSDLDFVVFFSNRPNKIEVFGTGTISSVGGQGTDYYAQSFKALDSYIVDAGIWIEHYSGTTPDFRVQIWENNASGYPDKNNVIASSRVIDGSEIFDSPGRFFIHPSVSIAIEVGETYWLVIDGYYDHTTSGSGKSRWTPSDSYKDGYFIYSNNEGSTWIFSFDDYDLNFIVTFSPRLSAIQVDGDMAWQSIGGTGTWNYAGQSFKALDKYILDTGVWLGNYSSNCPDIRILLCGSTLGGDPNVTQPIATSLLITGDQIMSEPGRYYLQLTKPIEVVPGQTYYLIIDGWYDNTTAASVRTYERYDDPYEDGCDCGSSDGGVSWTHWNSYDLEMDIRFSDVPYKAQCGETSTIQSVGGASGTDYYAQSFVALNDYIADAGIWIEKHTMPTPDFRVLLCSNDVDHPNITDVIAASMVIAGTTIDSNPGLFDIKPITPIPVEVGETYWIVIDGYYDHVTAGNARSRGVLNSDTYPDGEFKYSNNGVTWSAHSLKDLKLEVIFTHVNEPPAEPTTEISPEKPYDSDDLTASFDSFDFEQESVEYFIEWYKDTVLQPAWTNNRTVPNSATSPLESWMVKVTPNDGHINGTAGSYTVEVQADIHTIDHPLTVDSQTFNVFTKSNTTITDFAFDIVQSKITFMSTGPTGAQGFCNITIQKTLMDAPWIVEVNGVGVTPVVTSNATHTVIHFTYSTSSIPIEIQGRLIVPEFTPTILLLAIAIITLAIAALRKKNTTGRR